MATLVSPGINVSEIDLTTIVPGVSTTVGGIAGVFPWGPIGELMLISDEKELVKNVGEPTSINPQTFFVGASFLAYGSALFVSRAANTTTLTANSALNAIANNNTANLMNCTVLNTTDYYANLTYDSGTQWIARYPGALGNSLKINVCDSQNAYSSNINLNFANATTNVTGTAAIAVGANALVLSFVSNTTVNTAQSYATIVASGLTVGDLIIVGNTTLGFQRIPINNLAATTNATVATVTVGLGQNYLSPYPWVANSTVNGNSTIVNVQRGWQYQGVVAAPNTSPWVTQYGNSAAVDTLSVVVTDDGGLITGVKGSILETYSGLSRATDASTLGGQSNYYATVINQNSAWVWFANDRAGAISNTSNAITTSTNVTPYAYRFVGGQDGLPESSVAFGDLANAWNLFQNTNVPVSLILQGMPYGGPGGPTYQLVNYLNDNIATIRKDNVVFCTPDDTVVVQNQNQPAEAIVSWASNVRDSSYIVIDSGYKYMYDKYNDVYRWIPLNGDIAGLCARTDRTNDPWWSPAGFNRGAIKNIVKLRWNPDQADRDLLYPAGVNPVVSFPGQGTVLFGDKTATKQPSAFDRINVRRLFIVLEAAIKKASQYSLFEFNDTFTRAQFVNMVVPYLRNVKSRRGIFDFKVVCDETNNTPYVIDSNQFIGDIYIKPARSINYIQLNFVAVATGVDFSVVVGTFD